ncbi:hypothetical protein BD779DRAFT_1670451 [Infundibulicybe gibba]|nr:hypothetical protein BD779DRAFT_1670451 [Infundibulicybe gibba]
MPGISNPVQDLVPEGDSSLAHQPSSNLPSILHPPGRISATASSSSSLTANRLLRHQRSVLRPASLPTTELSKIELDKDVTASTRRLRGMSLSNKIASLQIDFLIIGGGIAGLASAFALCQAGHRVRVLEKTDAFHQRSGGIRVPPNLTKILLEWGLGDKLDRAPRCRKSQFHTLETGELLGLLEWKEEIIRETGGEFILMHHHDLYEMLYDLAVSAGAEIFFNKTITSVSVDEVTETPWVTLADGSTLCSDVVIGADGYRSLMREVVTGQPDDGVDSGHSFYTAIIPSHKLRADPEWAKWVDVPEWPMWMSDSRSVLCYPVRDGEEYCIQVYWPDNEIKADAPNDEGWDVVCSTDVIDFTGYSPMIARLFKLAPTALRTKHVIRSHIEDWVDETGKLLLIGEAAHPLLPCSTHSTSLVVEDAQVLGVLMSRLRSWDQLPQFMEAFQDIRQGRCHHVYYCELNNAALVTLPPGEHRDMRNAGMRLSLQAGDCEWDENQLRAQWDEIGEVFGYNAREAAEDWWVKWGTLTESTQKIVVHEPLQMRCETLVAISV